MPGNAKIRARGVVRDVAPIDVAPELYTDAINMVVRDGYQARIGGLADVFGDPTFSPVYLQPVLTTTVAYWMYATLDGGIDRIRVTDGVTHSDITPGVYDTNNRQNPWTGGILNGVPVINGGFDEPQFWDLSPGNNVQTLPGWEAGARCGALRTHRNFLIALDYTPAGGPRNENLVKWSDSAEPGSLPDSWTPLATNDSGDVSLAGTAGAVIDGATLRNAFVCYKQSSCFIMEFIGGQFIFNLRPLFANVGILSRNCVVEFLGQHAVLTDGDFVVHDGNQVQSVVDTRMRRLIFDNISASNFRNSFLALNKPRSEIWICFPTGDNVYANTAVVWSYEDNQFGIRELYGTPHAAHGIMPLLSAGAVDWDSQTLTWADVASSWDQTNFNPSADSLVLADPTFDFLEVDIGSQLVDQDIEAAIVRHSLDFGDAQAVKTVRSVWPRIEGNAGDVIKISIGEQMEAADAITFTAAVDFVIGTDRKIDAFATGRLLSFAFQSSGGQSWRISGFDVEFATVGNY